jgi:hypothetical protein
VIGDNGAMAGGRWLVRVPPSSAYDGWFGVRFSSKQSRIKGVLTCGKAELRMAAKACDDGVLPLRFGDGSLTAWHSKTAAMRPPQPP